jgi:hypothetical protein
MKLIDPSHHDGSIAFTSCVRAVGEPFFSRVDAAIRLPLRDPLGDMWAGKTEGLE